MGEQCEVVACCVTEWGEVGGEHEVVACVM